MLGMAKKRGDAWTPERIRELRKRRGLTQTEAATKFGVSRRSWAAWESGEQTPSPPIVVLLGLLDQEKI